MLDAKSFPSLILNTFLAALMIRLPSQRRKSLKAKRSISDLPDFSLFIWNALGDSSHWLEPWISHLISLRCLLLILIPKLIPDWGEKLIGNNFFYIPQLVLLWIFYLKKSWYNRFCYCTYQNYCFLKSWLEVYNQIHAFLS